MTIAGIGAVGRRAVLRYPGGMGDTSAAPASALPAPRWTVVIPYYNERDYLPGTLKALLAQTLRPLTLILVDNASTDDTTALCHDVLKDATGIDVVYLHEPSPGKTNALECGLARVETEFVAFWDADTYYPPHYLARCDAVYAAAKPNVLAVFASRLAGPPTHGGPRLRQMKTMLWARIFTRQALTGGFGHTFRTAGLRAAGGYSTALWPYVFEDHEVMQRLFKIGRSRYDFDIWCVPSMRRADRSNVDWTYFEKRLYGVVPFILKDWYFYTFLAGRFAQRKLDQTKLRAKSWVAD